MFFEGLYINFNWKTTVFIHDSLLGYLDIEVVNGGEIETKIVYLVKGHPINAQLQYNGTWHTGMSVEKIKYYGNQSGL